MDVTVYVQCYILIICKHKLKGYCENNKNMLNIFLTNAYMKETIYVDITFVKAQIQHDLGCPIQQPPI